MAAAPGIAFGVPEMNDLTSTRLIGVVVCWKPLCGTFSDHAQLTRKRLFWFAIVSRLSSANRARSCYQRGAASMPLAIRQLWLVGAESANAIQIRKFQPFLRHVQKIRPNGRVGRMARAA